MTNEEAAKILATIKAAYPNAYRDANSADIKTAVNLWAAMFADDDYKAVGAALRQCIATCKYPPTIAEVRDAMASQRCQVMGVHEAWVLVKTALKNGYYGYKKEFDKLPENIQRVIGNAYILRDWSMADIGELDTVIASNFARAYNAVTKRENEFARLPGDLQRMLMANERKMLGEGSE